MRPRHLLFPSLRLPRPSLGALPTPQPTRPAAPRRASLAASQDPASQLAQLVALEHLLAVELPERSREAPLVLKALYDSDVVAEELILAW